MSVNASNQSGSFSVEGLLITESDYDHQAQYVRVGDAVDFDTFDLEDLAEKAGVKPELDFSVPLSGTVANYGRVRVTIEVLAPPARPRARLTQLSSRRWRLDVDGQEIPVETLGHGKRVARTEFGVVGFRRELAGSYASVE
jgi:hypothetical protein